MLLFFSLFLPMQHLWKATYMLCKLADDIISQPWGQPIATFLTEVLPTLFRGCVRGNKPHCAKISNKTFAKENPEKHSLAKQNIFSTEKSSSHYVQLCHSFFFFFFFLFSIFFWGLLKGSSPSFITRSRMLIGSSVLRPTKNDTDRGFSRWMSEIADLKSQPPSCPVSLLLRHVSGAAPAPSESPSCSAGAQACNCSVTANDKCCSRCVCVCVWIRDYVWECVCLTWLLWCTICVCYWKFYCVGPLVRRDKQWVCACGCVMECAAYVLTCVS